MRVSLAMLCLVLGPWSALPAPAQEADPVTLSFAFIGCNRVGWSAEHGHPLPPSTANTPQLMQTFSDVAALGGSRGRPVDYLFLLGDIVRNESSPRTLAAQLEQWQELYEKGALGDSSASSTKVVPIVGNHEVLVSVEYAHGEYYEVPDTGTNAAWLRWLNANKHPPQPAGNGPTPASSPGDLLRGDNSQLTYSFGATTADGKSVHFLLINTDSDSSYQSAEPSCYQPPRQDVDFHGHPVTGTSKLAVPGWIPIEWIEKDLQAAAGSDYVFALGHKPVVFPQAASYEGDSVGRETIFNCGRHRLGESLVSSFGETPNFVAYLTSHQHLWDAFQVSTPSRSFWQIVAGDGGSPLISGDTFGFTLVEIHRSGKVMATRFDRPVPADYYYSSTGVGPAQPTKTFAIHP